MPTRRAALFLPFALAACAGDDPVRTNFEPLRYDYLGKLRLNVADIAFEPLPPPGPLDTRDPAPPGPALLTMAQDRLVAGGSLGRAVFRVDDATIRRLGDGLEGNFAVHLDVLTSEGNRAGFAEAQVSRRATGIGRDLPAALYDLTRQMMDDMNVEFEFQLRRSLRDYLQETSTAPLPPAVEQQSLPSP